MNYFILLLISLLFSPSLMAQKSVTNQSLVWYGYFQNLKINDRFSVHTDIQERHFMAPVKQSQFVMRSTFKTRIASNWDAGVGFCFFYANTDPSVEYNLNAPELRPFLEISNKQKLKRVSIAHRYRLESRFFHNIQGTELDAGYDFGNMRFRYQFGVDFPLNKPRNDKHAIKLRLTDEFMLNFGKKIKYNLFDQNRVQVILNYAPVRAVAFEIGYTNWFQQRPSGDNYFNRHILRMVMIHHIDIKTKKEKTNTNPDQSK